MKRKPYIIGIDLGGTAIKTGIVSFSGKLFHHETNPTNASAGRKTVLKNIIAAVESTLTNSGITQKHIFGIGVGTPGLPNKNGTIITGAYNIPGWKGTPLGQVLRKKYHLPVRIENDVSAVTLGEATWGAGKGFKHIICITLGTGLGGGIIINKNLYRGESGYAGEFGHMVIAAGGEKCTSGVAGGFEAYSSAFAITRIAQEKTKGKRISSILKTALLPENHPQQVKMIFQAYQQGDRLAHSILQEFGYYLGIGIATLVNCFDPERVIISGGIAQSGQVLLSLMQPAYIAHLLPFHKKKKKIVLGKFDNRAGIIGAASLIMRQYTTP